MPLKIVKRKGRESLYLRGTVRGKTVFESCETTDRSQAEGYRIKRERELWERETHGTRAVVKFPEAVESYLDAEDRKFSTRRAVLKLTIHFQNAPLDQIGQEALDEAYRKLLGKNVTGATKKRHVLTPLRAILEHAARRGWCTRPAFEMPTIIKTRTHYRTPAEVDALISNASDHVKPLFTFLAGCGPRPSEAFQLQWTEVDLRAARCVLGQKQGNWRYADMPARVVAALASLPHRSGAVFRSGPPTLNEDGTIARLAEPYRTGETEKGVASGQAKRSFSTAARKAGWPGEWRIWTEKRTGQEKKEWVSAITPYVLRHSWASWHYCVNKDLLLLKSDGGWSTIDMVAHYAKMMPDTYRAEILTWWAAGFEGMRKKA